MIIMTGSCCLLLLRLRWSLCGIVAVLLMLLLLVVAVCDAYYCPYPLLSKSSSARRQCRPLSLASIIKRQQRRPPPPSFLLMSSSTTTTAAATDDEAPTTPATTVSVIPTENRGDSRGSAVLLENVSVYRGSSQILSNINWRVEPRTKWALVGSNGAGKSTLLKALVGEISHENGGTIKIGTKQQSVGYLQQTAASGSTRSVYDEAASGMTAINNARVQMEKAAELGDLNALERATTEYENLGGYKQHQKVESVLKGLGFVGSNLQKQTCDNLSGGWQMRVAFARLLLSEPSLCLMDEPGNHLDQAAKKWLVRYLANYDGDGAMILVTHDVELLSSMDHIAEIVPPGNTGGATNSGNGGGSLQIYKSCNYKQYLELKRERAAAAVAEYERNLAKAEKLQGFVDRFGASATKASAAQSRVKQLEKMKLAGNLDAPSNDIISQRFRPTMVLPDPPKAMGDVLLSLQHADIGYGGGDNNDNDNDNPPPLVSNVNLEITRGMKLLVRGPNGSGKSTLLHSLRGTLPLLNTGGQQQGTISCRRTENSGLRLGVFTQDLAQELDPNSRAVDLVIAHGREGPHGDITIPEKDARAAMGRLGLQGDKPLQRISDLSGGEKARVALAMFALKPSNLYLLDEASNHLDSECVEALSEALSQWGDDQGALVVISHDTNFCKKIDFTHVATVQDGSMVIEQRGARESDWIIDNLSSGNNNMPSANGGDEASSSNGSAQVDAEPKREISAALRKKAYNSPKRITKLEQLIEKAEEKIFVLDAEMLENGSDVGLLVDLTKEKEALEGQVIEYMDEWEELEALLSEIDSS